MTKHLVDLYQSSLKGKEKDMEIHFAYPYQDNKDIYFDHLDMTHLDVVDFFKQNDYKVYISCNDNN
jgi:hypothetical protein